MPLRRVNPAFISYFFHSSSLCLYIQTSIRWGNWVNESFIIWTGFRREMIINNMDAQYGAFKAECTKQGIVWYRSSSFHLWIPFENTVLYTVNVLHRNIHNPLVTKFQIPFTSEISSYDGEFPESAMHWIAKLS